MPSTLRQGVTSVVVGNCGMSPFPASSATELASWAGGDPAEMDLDFGSFGGFLERVEASEPAVNVAALVGHGSVRDLAMGLERRAPVDEELAAMRRTVAEAMDAGAVGLSTGLIYVPGMYSSTDEIVALAEEAARAGGLYASHIRGEGAHLFRAVNEAIEIGRRAGLAGAREPPEVRDLAHVGPGERAAGPGARRRRRDRRPVPVRGVGLVLWSLLPEWAPVAELPGDAAPTAPPAIG